jgi:hypothetical protein
MTDSSLRGLLAFRPKAVALVGFNLIVAIPHGNVTVRSFEDKRLDDGWVFAVRATIRPIGQADAARYARISF